MLLSTCLGEFDKMKEFKIFTARYCGTCRGLKRRLTEIQEKLIGVEISYIDIDVERKLTRSLKVDKIPVLIYFIDGVEQTRLLGQLSNEQILALLEEN